MDTLELNGLIWLVLFPFVTISIILGFLVMCHYNPVQRTLDAWLISLLIAISGDIAVLVLTQALLYYREYSIDIWEEELCHFYVWAWGTFQFAGLFTLVGLSIDRVLLIKQRGKYAYYVSSRTKAILFVLWLAAVFIGIVPVSGWNEIEYYYRDIGACTYMPYEVHRNFAVFLVVAEVCSMVVCLVCLIDILCHLRYLSNRSFLTITPNHAHSNRNALAQTSVVSSNKSSQVKKSIEVAAAYDNCRVGCILVLLVFILNHIPYMVIAIIGIVSGSQWTILRIVMIWFLVIQGLLVPHFLWLFNTRYRVALRHIIECLKGNGSLFTSETMSKNVILETYLTNNVQQKPHKPKSVKPTREDHDADYYTPTGYSQYSKSQYSTTRSFQYESFLPIPTKTVSEPNLAMAPNNYKNQNGFLERSRSVDKDLDLDKGRHVSHGPSVGERDLQMDRVVAVVHGQSMNNIIVEEQEIQQSSASGYPVNRYDHDEYDNTDNPAMMYNTTNTFKQPANVKVVNRYATQDLQLTDTVGPRISPMSSSSSTQSPRPKRMRFQSDVYTDCHLSTAVQDSQLVEHGSSQGNSSGDVLDMDGQADSTYRPKDKMLHRHFPGGEDDSQSETSRSSVHSQLSEYTHTVSSDEHTYGKGHEKLKRLVRKKSSLSSHRSSVQSAQTTSSSSSESDGDTVVFNDVDATDGPNQSTPSSDITEEFYTTHPHLKRSPANYNLHKTWQEVHQRDRDVEEIIISNSDIIVIDTDDVDEFSTSEFDDTSVDEDTYDVNVSDGHVDTNEVFQDNDQGSENSVRNASRMEIMESSEGNPKDIYPMHSHGELDNTGIVNEEKIVPIVNLVTDQSPDHVINSGEANISNSPLMNSDNMRKSLANSRNDDIVIPSPPLQATVKPNRREPSVSKHGQSEPSIHHEHSRSLSGNENTERIMINNRNHGYRPHSTHKCDTEQTESGRMRVSEHNVNNAGAMYNDTAMSMDTLSPIVPIRPSYADVDIHREITKLDIEHFVTENPLYESLTRKERFEMSKRQIAEALDGNNQGVEKVEVDVLTSSELEKGPRQAILIADNDNIDIDKVNSVTVVEKTGRKHGSTAEQQKVDGVRYAAVPYSGYTKAFYRQFSGDNNNQKDANHDHDVNIDNGNVKPDQRKELSTVTGENNPIYSRFPTQNDNKKFYFGKTKSIHRVNGNNLQKTLSPISPTNNTSLTIMSNANNVEMNSKRPVSDVERKHTSLSNGNIVPSNGTHDMDSHEFMHDRFSEASSPPQIYIKPTYKKLPSMNNNQNKNKANNRPGDITINMGKVIYNSVDNGKSEHKTINENNIIHMDSTVDEDGNHKVDYDDLINSRGRGKILGHYGAL